MNRYMNILKDVYNTDIYVLDIMVIVDDMYLDLINW